MNLCIRIAYVMCVFDTHKAIKLIYDMQSKHNNKKNEREL